jgi:hypothetical protein
MLAEGITSIDIPIAADLMAQSGPVVDDQGTAGGVDLAQFTLVGLNAQDQMVALAAGYATGTLTFSANPAADDTVTIGGTAITYKASGAAGSQINIGATKEDTAQALVTYITAHPSLGVEASRSGAVVTFTAIERGLSGNSITLAESSTATTVSGANLTGGDLDGVPEATPYGVILQPLKAGQKGPVRTTGVFNHLMVIFPAGVNTLGEKKSLLAGSTLGVRHLP